jgi:hypothetical protein
MRVGFLFLARLYSQWFRRFLVVHYAPFCLTPRPPTPSCTAIYHLDIPLFQHYTYSVKHTISVFQHIFSGFPAGEKTKQVSHACQTLQISCLKQWKDKNVCHTKILLLGSVQQKKNPQRLDYHAERLIGFSLCLFSISHTSRQDLVGSLRFGTH